MLYKGSIVEAHIIRLLCVGLGGMGHSDWSRAAKVKDFRIVAGVDVDDSAREQFEEKTGCPTFTSISEALTKVPADAALIAVPDEFHAPFSIQAMESGLDVICEKPMAGTLEEAHKMHHVSERLGRMLMVHHQLRWAPGYSHARQLIHDGVIGTLRHLEFDMYIYSDACLQGYRSRLPQLMLQDLGIHHFDLIRFITGEECKSVFARSWNSNEDHVIVPATTNVYAILEMTGPVTASYRSDMRSITEQTGYGCRVAVTGSKGVLTIAKEGLSLQTYDGFAAKRPLKKIEPEKTGCGPMEAFARAIQTRKPTLTASGDNLKSLEIVFAAIESVKTGRVVSLGL